MSVRTADRAYEFIRKRLAVGDVNGGRLREQALAEDLGISRTPIREALCRLQSEGIIQQTPGRGASVRLLNRTELCEVYEMRELLECHAVVKAVGRLSEADFAELDAYCERIRELARVVRLGKFTRLDGEMLALMVKVDLGFHRKIMDASGNAMAIKMFDDLHILSRIQEYSARLPEENPLRDLADTWRAHRRILRALRAGDAEAARTYLSRHIRAGLEEHLTTLDRQSSAKSAARSAAKRRRRPGS